MAAWKLTTPKTDVQLALDYCRESTDSKRDSGISPDEQQRKIEAHAIENGAI